MINGSMIIEKIETNEQTAIKYDDGTMIVLQRYEVESNTFNAWGSCYSSSIKPGPKDFIVPFINIPVVIQTIESININGWITTYNENGSISTNIRPGAIQITRGTTGSKNSKYILNVLAIGRWK